MARAFDSDITSTRRVRDVKRTAIEKIAMKSPVFSSLKKGPKPKSSTPEWLVKTYADAVVTGVAEKDVEAADFENNLDKTTHLKSRYHKRRRVPAVGDIAEESGVQYGVEGSLFKDNVKDKMKELYVDCEAVTLGDQEAVAGSGSTTASVTRGLSRWLSVHNDRFTDADTTPAAGNRIPAGSLLLNKAAPANITEDEIEGLLQSICETRKDDAESPVKGLCSPAMRRRFSSFTKLGDQTSSLLPLRRFTNKKEGVIDVRVTKYESDFGTIDLMTHYRLPSGVHFIGADMDMLELGVLRAPRFKELEDRGAGPVGIVDVIFVLMCLNPQAHCKATSLASEAA